VEEIMLRKRQKGMTVFSGYPPFTDGHFTRASTSGFQIRPSAWTAGGSW